MQHLFSYYGQYSQDDLTEGMQAKSFCQQCIMHDKDIAEPFWKLKSAIISVLVCISFILSGCTAGEIGMTGGAVIGGALGSAGGQVIGRNTTATVSAAAGGIIIGGLIGYLINRNTTRYCRYYDDSNYPYDAPCGKP